MSGGRGASALCRPLTMHEVKMRRTITTAAIAAMLLTATVALAAPTPEQKCQAAKNSAAGKYAACRQTAVKTLVSTGDATKYGAAIAKCEASFAGAWQKAIAAAAKAGASCPDAPLVAGDYKSVIDAHSANVATTLGGGGLTTPSTCGNGFVEGGESCDFETALPTCSAATAGAQPFGEVTCAAGCTANTGACRSCAAVGGKSAAGACWFIGPRDASCSATCGAAGLVFDPATVTYAGSGGTSANCRALMELWNPGSPNNTLLGGGNPGTGCNSAALDRFHYENSSPTLAETSSVGLSRVCACMQP